VWVDASADAAFRIHPGFSGRSINVAHRDFEVEMRQERGLIISEVNGVSRSIIQISRKYLCSREVKW
jgi:hypothetical protein